MTDIPLALSCTDYRGRRMVFLQDSFVVSKRSEVINGKKVYRIKTTHKADHIQETKYGYAVQYPQGQQS